MPRHDDVPLRALLKDLEVTAVAFCPEGANGEADIVLYKAHPDHRHGGVSKAPDSYLDLRDRLEAEVSRTYGGPSTYCWVRDFGPGWVIFEQNEVSYRVGYVADESGALSLTGPPETVTTDTEWVPLGKDTDMPNTDTTDLAPLQEAIDKAVAEAVDFATAAYAAQYVAEQEAFEKAVAEAADDEPSTDADPLAKMDPAARALIEKARDEAAAATAEVEKMRDEAATVVFKSRAQALPHLGSVEELAPLLKGVAAQAPELYEGLEQTLVAANERIGKGLLFSEIGTGEVDPDSAAGRIEKALTDDPAEMIKRLEADPSLWGEYLAEKRRNTPVSHDD